MRESVRGGDPDEKSKGSMRAVLKEEKKVTEVRGCPVGLCSRDSELNSVARGLTSGWRT
jgi:hypothetical protein